MCFYNMADHRGRTRQLFVTLDANPLECLHLPSVSDQIWEDVNAPVIFRKLFQQLVQNFDPIFWPNNVYRQYGT